MILKFFLCRNRDLCLNETGNKRGGGKPSWHLVSYFLHEGCIISAIMKSLGDKEYKSHLIPGEIWIYFNVASNFSEKVGSVSAMSHAGCMHSRYPQSQTGVMLLQFMSFPRPRIICLFTSVLCYAVWQALSHVTITTIKIFRAFLSPKSSHMQLTLLPIHSLWLPLICFLSLWLCLF